MIQTPENLADCETQNGKAKSEIVVEMMQQMDHWKSTLPTAPSGNVFSSERTLPETHEAAR